jgi:acyl-coenzyme A thioesterase PaaI-like protein
MSGSPADPGPSLQQRYAPHSRCFGCGPANEHGLRIESRPSADDPTLVVAEWSPAAHHEAFDGVLNGGIIGALLDCHSNWTAAWHLMGRRGADTPPVCVTAEYAVKLVRPTPTDRPVRLTARVLEATDERATIEATLEADGRVCATCRGTFIAVRPEHPAYGSWGAG